MVRTRTEVPGIVIAVAVMLRLGYSLILKFLYGLVNMLTSAF